MATSSVDPNGLTSSGVSPSGATIPIHPPEPPAYAEPAGLQAGKQQDSFQHREPCNGICSEP